MGLVRSVFVHWPAPEDPPVLSPDAFLTKQDVGEGARQIRQRGRLRNEGFRDERARRIIRNGQAPLAAWIEIRDLLALASPVGDAAAGAIGRAVTPPRRKEVPMARAFSLTGTFALLLALTV